jgi:RNA polymerase sigma-70 factor (ECF subfamily)
MTDARSDEDLMLAVRAGDELAFAALYERHKAGVLNFCYQMLRNYEDAADVFQEAFRYLYAHAATYEPSARFTTYLYRIARNLCIDILRRRKRWNLRALEPEVDVQDPAPAARSRIEDEEIEANLRSALEEVPDPYREVVLLRVTQGLAYEDIARITDTPLGTVKSRLHTGFEVLRQILKRRKLIE